jgi:hypothetical protein
MPISTDILPHPGQVLQNSSSARSFQPDPSFRCAAFRMTCALRGKDKEWQRRCHSLFLIFNAAVILNEMKWSEGTHVNCYLLVGSDVIQPIIIAADNQS